MSDSFNHRPITIDRRDPDVVVVTWRGKSRAFGSTNRSARIPKPVWEYLIKNISLHELAALVSVGDSALRS